MSNKAGNVQRKSWGGVRRGDGGAVALSRGTKSNHGNQADRKSKRHLSPHFPLVLLSLTRISNLPTVPEA